MPSLSYPEEWYFLDPEDASFLADSGTRATLDDYLSDPPLEEGYDYEEEGGEGGDSVEDITTAIYVAGGVGALALLYLLIRG